MPRIIDAQHRKLPRHVVIVMDGNGRWAKNRNLPRIAGHKAGVNTLKKVVKLVAEKGIEALTVYAFSSENWKRPGSEVSMLMELFMTSLQKGLAELNANNVRLRFIGDISAFPGKLQTLIKNAEESTSNNDGLDFTVAINYGGRWDITNAIKTIGTKIRSGDLDIDQIDERLVQSCLSLPDIPEPDLFIRTGGEKRISNYLLWQIAYTELFFTDCLWPDFESVELDAALSWYHSRERRFGCTSEQLKRKRHA